MNLFQWIGQYFWIACIAVTFANYRRALDSPPSGLDRPAAASPQRGIYLRRAALVGVLPWIVMGAGIVIGGVANVWAYFRPQDGNPWVLAWFALLFALAVANAAWVFLAGGARKIRQYDLHRMVGGLRGGQPSELVIKLMAAAGPFWILLWMFLVSTMNVRVPH